MRKCPAAGGKSNPWGAGNQGSHGCAFLSNYAQEGAGAHIVCAPVPASLIPKGVFEHQLHRAGFALEVPSRDAAPSTLADGRERRHKVERGNTLRGFPKDRTAFYSRVLFRSTKVSGLARAVRIWHLWMRVGGRFLSNLKFPRIGGQAGRSQYRKDRKHAKIPSYPITATSEPKPSTCCSAADVP